MDDARPSGSDLILGVGTFRVGVENCNDNADPARTMGALTWTEDSTIDLGSYATGLRQLSFANSSGITWTGTPIVTNWQGVAQSSSDVAEILFGTGGLTSSQLGQIYLANQNIAGGMLLGGAGELEPIPETPVVWGAAAIAAFVVWRERRRLRLVISAGRSKECPSLLEQVP